LLFLMVLSKLNFWWLEAAVRVLGLPVLDPMPHLEPLVGVVVVLVDLEQGLG
jgi:hypothetical protein